MTVIHDGVGAIDDLGSGFQLEPPGELDILGCAQAIVPATSGKQRLSSIGGVCPHQKWEKLTLTGLVVSQGRHVLAEELDEIPLRMEERRDGTAGRAHGVVLECCR